MEKTKRYYWIKLKTDFFNLAEIDFLLSQKDGCQYVVLYQMLCLQTANNNGELASRVGEMIIPYDPDKIARDTKYFSKDTVIVAMELFKKLNLIYTDDGICLKIAGFENMVGSETGWAKQKREQREKQMYMELRIGEVLALSKENVDLENKVLYVKRTLTNDKEFAIILGNKTKTYSGNRTLPIPDFLVPIFEEQLKYTNENLHNLIFTNNDSYIRTSAINKELKKIFKEELNLDPKNISTHCLRHTYGTRCIEAGMTAVVLQRLMGHKDVTVTLNTYTSVFNKFKEDELEKINTYLNNNQLNFVNNSN